jgi:hypothetical protein
MNGKDSCLRLVGYVSSIVRLETTTAIEDQCSDTAIIWDKENVTPTGLMAPDPLFVVWEQLFCHAMHCGSGCTYVTGMDFLLYIYFLGAWDVGAIMQSCVAMAKLLPL